MYLHPSQYPTNLLFSPLLTIVPVLILPLTTHAQLQCYPKAGTFLPLQQSSTVLIKDCMHAIAQLPTSSEMREFRATAPTDLLYHLPHSVAAGKNKCEVLVTFFDGRQSEKTSWTDINLAAMQLMGGCVGSGLKDVFETSGGHKIVGERGGVLVAVGRARSIPQIG